MAFGTLAIDTLSTSGKISGAAVSVDADYLAYGSAKAWACFVQSSSHTFHDSFNMASLTDGGAGFSTVNYTNVFGNDDYASPGLGGKAGARLYLDSVGDAGKGTSSMQLFMGSAADGTGTDADDVNISCLGNLA